MIVTTETEAGIADTAIPPPRAARDLAFTGHADLTWLLHRAAQRMRTALDDVARCHGLTSARDWLVLSAIAAGPRQTQLSLAHALGIDKTTLTSLLDRMENRGFITRCLDTHDRRARIPVLTDAGRSVQRDVAEARDRIEASVFRGSTDRERQLLVELLTRLATEQTGDAARTHGSCI